MAGRKIFGETVNQQLVYRSSEIYCHTVLVWMCTRSSG